MAEGFFTTEPPEKNINEDLQIIKKEPNKYARVETYKTEMKISLQEPNNRFGQAKESTNLRIGQLKLSRLSRRKIKE